MTALPLTPSQTVGPYLSMGLRWPNGPYVVPEGTPNSFWLRGRVIDGNGDPVVDALVETWQADPDGKFPDGLREKTSLTLPHFRGLGRSETVDGEYAILTVKPGRLPDGAGGQQAPHLDVSVFARGLLNRVVTRLCFADEPEANAQDPVMAGLPDDVDRSSLLLQPSDDGYRLDIVLQGDRETVFFTV
jgi:protocatechuate 3,4-dioxygenase alpha subunit